MVDAEGCNGRSDGGSADLDGVGMTPMERAGNTAQGLLTTYFETVFNTALADLDKGSLPSVKFLMDLARHASNGGRVAESEYRSLAEVLWQEIEGQDVLGKAEAGAR